MKNIPYITLIEAPFGYGKSFTVNKYIKQYNILRVHYIHNEDLFFNSLINSFNTNKFDCPISEQFIDWYKFFNNLKYELILVIDDIDEIKDNNAIKFINFFIKNQSKNVFFILSSSIKLNLLENIQLLSNCLYMDSKALILLEKDFKSLFTNNKLNLNKNDIDFFYKSKGWAILIELYLQYKKNNINQNELNKYIELSCENLLKDINNFFSSDSEELLKSRLIDKKNLSNIIFDYLSKQNKSYFEYWLYIAINKSENVEKSIVYLQRAIKVCLKQNKVSKILEIYNRLINFYTINSDYKSVDLTLNECDKYLKISNEKEICVYLYLKANRLRQLQKYNESIKLLEEIINKISDNELILKFQTKAYVLYGLIEYQIGDYSKTREYYQKALYLSMGEQNFILKTEIDIMLAFLDAWEGKNTGLLDEKVIDLIETFPLKDQPMIWLNLAFYWILGEKIDIDFVDLILNKIEEINKTLNFNFLNPLIADIKARLLRFKGDYDTAFYYHKLALNSLEKDSFEYSHAELNMSLSLIKIGNLKDAQVLINSVYNDSIKNKSLGLAKEAEILMNQILPNKNKILNNIFVKNSDNLKNNNINFESDRKIRFELFGAFNTYLNEDIIKWSRKKCKNLIIQLLFNNKGIHREYLAEILFPDDDNSLKNLDVHIHSIRKIFDKDKNKDNSIIIFQNSSYFFNKNIIYTSDITDFDYNYNLWLKEDNSDKKNNISKNILDLYKGDLLPEIDFAEYYLAERVDYRKKIINVLKYMLNLKENIDFLCTKLIEIDPYTQDNFYLVMSLIFHDKKLLKTIYKKYLNIAKNDLNIEPSVEIVELYNKLLIK